MSKDRWIHSHVGRLSAAASVFLTVTSFTFFAPATAAVAPSSLAAENATFGNVQTLVTANYEDSPGLYEAMGAVQAEVSKEWLEAEAKKKAEAEAAAKAAEEAAASRASAPMDIAKPFYTGGGSKDQWLRDAGIAESDWGYVDFIAQKESSWNPNAVNSSSGASGLIQALPCGKVPGNCFDPVDNLKWADGYAKDRYGSWKGAYEFWVANSWW